MVELGKLLILLGGTLVLLGLLLILGGRVPWFGRLPGDIVVQRGHFSLYFPLMTCLLVSLLLSVLFAFFRR